MIYFIANKSRYSYLAAIMRYGHGRRHCVWTSDLSGALGFDDIDIPLAKAIVVALGGRHVIVPETFPNGESLQDVVASVEQARGLAASGTITNIEFEAHVRSKFGEP